MRVSVVVPVYNDGETLARCLEAILASSHRPAEVIVVDDHSTDGSAAIAARFDCRLIRLPRNLGVGPARNAGARAATGDVLFFTDGDVVLGERTLERGLETLSRCPEAVAVVGIYAKTCGDQAFPSVFKNLTVHWVQFVSAEYSYFFIGNCGMIRRRAFFEMEGFDEDGPFSRCLEDVELGLRLTQKGYLIRLDKEMQVVHHRRYTLGSLLYSDLCRRAVPWTQLILRHRGVRFDSCTRAKDLLCLLISYLVPGCALLGLAVDAAWFYAAALGVFSMLALEASFYRFVYSEKGAAFTLGAAGLRYLYFFVSGFGAMAGCVLFLFGNARPKPVEGLES